MPNTGRPTKYDPKYCDEIIRYFDVQPYQEIVVTTVSKRGVECHTTKRFANDLPLLSSFAAHIGVHRDTIHQWTKDHTEFSDAIARAKDAQQHVLITNGLLGLYNSSFAVFAATNILGWRNHVKAKTTQHTLSLADLAKAAERLSDNSKTATV